MPLLLFLHCKRLFIDELNLFQPILNLSTLLQRLRLRFKRSLRRTYACHWSLRPKQICCDQILMFSCTVDCESRLRPPLGIWSIALPKCCHYFCAMVSKSHSRTGTEYHPVQNICASPESTPVHYSRNTNTVLLQTIPFQIVINLMLVLKSFLI